MYCAISGEVAQEPVISTVSGHVFERRLIEKALEASRGLCPITNKEIDATKDLIPVKINIAVKPRPISATSIPGMLSMFQNEWDDLMLEQHELRQQLFTTRKELSHALYQHEAACRVIARLSKELDQSRAANTTLQLQVAEKEAQLVEIISKREDEINNNTISETAPLRATEVIQNQPCEMIPVIDQVPEVKALSNSEMVHETLDNQKEETDRMIVDEEEGRDEPKQECADMNDNEITALNADVLEVINEFFEKASKSRKKRKHSSGIASREEIAQWETRFSLEMQIGLSCLCKVPSDWQQNYSFVVGAEDGALRLTDTMITNATYCPDRHNSRILSVKAVANQSFVLSCAQEDFILWELEENIKRCLTIPAYSLSYSTKSTLLFTGTAPHPNGNFAFVGMNDGGWGLFDLKRPDVPLTMACTQMRSFSHLETASGPLTAHPDGVIFAIPNQTNIRIWELRKPSNVQTFQGHEFPIDSVVFCENGYYMASADSKTVCLWDLRKQAQIQILHTNPQNNSRFKGVCEFDHHGKYIAYADANGCAYINALKPWSNVVSVPHHPTPISAFAFTEGTQAVAFCAGNGRLSVLAPKAHEAS
mmetsp:Transcript_2184/g.3399  ORF Transcript_2184/g.3399 Transcript_2184/m.3399 type:complete len:595 (+) Transcript_2184:49-1833(+)|eukprot:CAMPEP_0197315386 /NCGR_PEP_ID=MMETSP0891-20130614/38019_1 /TAXON_ID=44058 ORGANISM="Aureoumbra lagunensis, Strain CCMP1510" /NCGR_SAMPLE_ID=MMETSP0891 /ASSEMBLY_ACC=CAM_ASM_000534 /LENGTH=594 /DNA_ID=CAMNT_0042804309 /DNA_START=46 /DNA_END=1830 /DNA_ORIENTATION=-